MVQSLVAGHFHIRLKLEKFMRQRIILVCWLLLFTLLTAGQSLAWAEETQRPQMSAVAEIGRIGKAAKGTAGVAAIHLETGRKIAHNADEFFPMASTVKVAVAAKILDLADKGQISLTSRIPVKRSELAPGGPLGDIHWRHGLSFSAADLLAKAYRANPAYDADPRDQATPSAMLGLLCKIWLEDGVSRSARSMLLPMMERSATGLKGIRGRLPVGTIVADKTGTLAGTVNDVGFITLPDGKGHIAIVVFVKGSEAPSDTQEAAIVDIARLVYDYYLISAQ